MKFALKALFIYLPLGILLIALSVANRAPVLLSLDPFNEADPWMAFNIPLFWIIFATLGVGIIIGSASTWWQQGRFRKEARSQKFEATRAKNEIEKIKEQTKLIAKNALPAPKAQ